MFSGPFRFGITTNYEFLLFMELDLDPCSGSFSGFVSRIGALADQAFTMRLPPKVKITRYTLVARDVVEHLLLDCE
jgi:hypothetical protein